LFVCGKVTDDDDEKEEREKTASEGEEEEEIEVEKKEGSDKEKQETEVVGERIDGREGSSRKEKNVSRSCKRRECILIL
jgi:hypothetical protein